jgi:hypothetical protein
LTKRKLAISRMNLPANNAHRTGKGAPMLGKA